MPRRRISPNQLSLFDPPQPTLFDQIAGPEATPTDAPKTGWREEFPDSGRLPSQTSGEFVIWYANMNGQGEHALATINGSPRFAASAEIASKAAAPILFTFSGGIQAMREHHARLGKLYWKGEQYEIKEVL